MNVQKIINSNEITNLTEFDAFINMSPREQVKFILKHYDFINNFVSDELSLSADHLDNSGNVNSEVYDYLDTHDLAEVLHHETYGPIVKKGIESLIEAFSADDYGDLIKTNLLPYIDEDDELPSFIFYDGEDVDELENQWVIYFADNCSEIFKDGKFVKGINNLMFISAPEELKNGKGFEIGYLMDHITSDDESEEDSEGVDKVVIPDNVDEYIMFKASGSEIYNKIKNVFQFIVEVESAHDIAYVYKKDDTWQVFSNNGVSRYSNPNRMNVMRWIGSNFKKYGSQLRYTPNAHNHFAQIQGYLAKHRRSLNNNYNRGVGGARSGGGRGGHGENKKPVVQLDPDSNAPVQSWNSATDASRSLNISRTSITKVCHGQGMTAGGFGWRFA